jgi:hypothetical protein
VSVARREPDSRGSFLPSRQNIMRTQAKPFIVQVRKRKRRGVGDSQPASSLFGPAEMEKLADKPPARRAADGLFGGRSESGSGDQHNHDPAGARPVAGWPAPSNGGIVAASAAARVLPDLSRRDLLETVQVVKAEPRIRRKRRATRKPSEAASAAVVDLGQSKTDLPPLAAAPVTETGDRPADAPKRVRRQRLKWSSRRVRRGKTDAGQPLPRLGQRWKRRLPRASK